MAGKRWAKSGDSGPTAAGDERAPTVGIKPSDPSVVKWIVVKWIVVKWIVVKWIAGKWYGAIPRSAAIRLEKKEKIA